MMVEPVPFDELVKLYNTVMLVTNPHWRNTYPDEIQLVWGIVFGYIEDVSWKGWAIIRPLYEDVLSVSPMTMFNPGNLPTL